MKEELTKEKIMEVINELDFRPLPNIYLGSKALKVWNRIWKDEFKKFKLEMNKQQKEQLFIDNKQLAEELINKINIYLNTDIRINSSKKKISYGRFYFYNYMRYNTTLSIKQISRHLINQNHATVLHALKRFEDLYETDKLFKYNYNKITNENG